MSTAGRVKASAHYPRLIVMTAHAGARSTSSGWGWQERLDQSAPRKLPAASGATAGRRRASAPFGARWIRTAPRQLPSFPEKLPSFLFIGGQNAVGRRIGLTVDERRGFAAMLKRIEGNGVRTILVEMANRFARDLMVQEVGYAMLRDRGIELVAADSPTSFLDDSLPPSWCGRCSGRWPSSRRQ